MDETLKIKQVAEELRGMYESLYDAPSSVVSFSQLEDIDENGDMMENIEMCFSMAIYMLYNIEYGSMTPEEKQEASRNLVVELSQMVENCISPVSEDNDKEVSDTEDKACGGKKKKFSLRRKVKEMFDSMFKHKNHENKSDEILVKSNGNLSVWKSANGQYRWFASYSNNYRDDDMPSEIISKESHENFEKMVDSGEAEYPELWHWHTPGTAWGKADWISYDKENGIAMASGYVLEGHEKEAESLMSIDRPIGLSHGMPRNSIARDSSDPTIIVRHITKEISDLPLEKAANKLTSFEILKESDMAISDKKKEYLRQVGLSDEQISAIESANKEKAQTAEALSLESKEQAAAVTDAPVVENEKSATESAVQQEEAAAASKEQTDVSSGSESGDELKELLVAIATGMKGITDTVNELAGRVNALETKEVANGTPAASVAAILATQLSATSAKENLVRKNAPLAKSGPVETKSEDGGEPEYSNDPIKNSIIKFAIGK